MNAITRRQVPPSGSNRLSRNQVIRQHLIPLDRSFLWIASLLLVVAARAEPTLPPDLVTFLHFYHCPALLDDPALKEALPSSPGTKASPTEIAEFLGQSNRVLTSVVRSRWPDVPVSDDTLFAYERETGLLAVRGESRTQVRLAAHLAKMAGSMACLEVGMACEWVEAPASLIDAIVEKALNDQPDQQNAFEELCRSSKARVLATLSGTSRSGIPLRLTSGLLTGEKTPVQSHEREGRNPDAKDPRKGFSLEFDPTVFRYPPDSGIIDPSLSYTARCESLPATNLEAGFRIGFPGGLLESKLPFLDGQRRLVGVWSPVPASSDLRQALFVRLSLPGCRPIGGPDRMRNWIEAHAPDASPSSPRSAGLAPGLVLAWLPCPKDMIAWPDENNGKSNPNGAAKAVLGAAEIPFPAGSWVEWDQNRGLLFLCNTREAILTAFTHFGEETFEPPRLIGTALSSFEAPPEVVKRISALAAEDGDHSAAWRATISALKAGEVRAAETLWLESWIGLPARLECEPDRHERSPSDPGGINAERGPCLVIDPTFDVASERIEVAVNFQPASGSMAGAADSQAAPGEAPKAGPERIKVSVKAIPSVPYLVPGASPPDARNRRRIVFLRSGIIP